jgi:phage tail sheath protein FI
MGAFFHGAEVVELSQGVIPIQAVRSGIVGLVGTAPSWAVQAPAIAPAINTPTLVSSPLDAAMFGPLIQGYTIPYALAAIQEQGVGQVIVVNVFDPTRHYTTITNAPLSFPAAPAAQVINLGHMGISSTGTPGKPVVKNSAGTTTYVEGTDYVVDYFNGLITAKSGGAITSGEAMEITYSYDDPSKVVDADIIGTISGGVYTGFEALQTTWGTMGFFAKILIAPSFSRDATVAAAMIAMANTLRAMALIDCPAATTPAAAIANRGTVGNAFDTNSNRAMLLAPHLLFTDEGVVPTGVTVIAATGVPVTQVSGATMSSSYSSWMAGVMAQNDYANGYWFSPSNKEILGVLGPDVAMYQNPSDPNSDPNNLNAAGIVTVFNSYGTGILTWGNRSAEFPTGTNPDNFIPIRRTMDVIEDSAIQSMLQFIDQPITAALIDVICESVNGFLRSLVQRGGLIDGKCTFNPAENPSTQLAAGQLVLDIAIMPPPPLERLTFNVSLNQNFLTELQTQVQASAQ